MQKRALELATRFLPLVVCLALFHRGLFSWFVQDDFGSLLLAIGTRTWADAFHWLTQPLAQGVLRPLPDAYFYIVLYKLAGLNALPYRIAVFATQFANLLLLTSIARRFAGSPGAALGGTLVWTVNVSLVVGMVWTSGYSQILCCFFLLGGFLLFLKYVETGRASFWWAQCAAFLLGLGTLEIAAVYPFLLIAYCLVAARSHVWKTAPLAAIAIAYGAFSVWMIPRATSGPYVMHFDVTILRTLWHYWTVALGIFVFARDLPLGRLPALALSFLLTAGLAVAIAKADARRRGLAIVGIGWFLLTLAPVLPLRDQQMDYYLTIPTIGLALTVAALLPAVPRAAAAVWLGIYFVCSVAFIPAGLKFWDGRSQLARRLILSAQEARAAHPDRVLLLSGVTELLYYSAVYDRGLTVGGVTNIFLMPEGKIVSKPGFRPLERYELRQEVVEDLVKQDRAEVFQVAPDGSLRNVSGNYRRAPLTEGGVPGWLDLGLPDKTSSLGPGWHGVTDGVRWMSGRAEVRLMAPTHRGSRLRIRAIAPPLPEYAVRVTVTVNGIVVGNADIRDPSSTEHVFALPDSLMNASELKVTLKTNRTFRVPPDVRELGAAFGVIEVM